MIVAVLLFQKICLPLRQRRDDGIHGKFILTAPTKNRGIFYRFWCSFVANGQKKNRQPAISQRFVRLNYV
jgi:hypothetical protein